MTAEDSGAPVRIDWKLNARKIYDLARSSPAYCFVGARKVIVAELGFSHEPVEGRPGEIVRVTPLGVEVATGAGLVVLRKVCAEGSTESAATVFERDGIGVGAVLT